MSQVDGKMEFTFQASAFERKVVMTLSPHATLPVVLEAFEAFLLAAGYSFNGYVDIIDRPTDAGLTDQNSEYN